MRGGVADSEPAVVAKSIFVNHYDFYYEDPTPKKALLTPSLFRVLKKQHDDVTRTGQIGALDCDPWINAQDGSISGPHRFETLEKSDGEAVVRFNYTFKFGPESVRPQSVLIKLQRASPRSGWQLADLIMPNGQSLVDLLKDH